MKLSGLLVLALSFSLSAHASIKTLTVVDEDANALITALSQAGFKHSKDPAKHRAEIGLKGLACIEHFNYAIDPDQIQFGIADVACRRGVPLTESAFTDKGHKLGKAVSGLLAHRVDEVLQKHESEAYLGFDCAMGKCAFGPLDIACRTQLDVESSQGRWSCDIAYNDYE